MVKFFYLSVLFALTLNIKAQEYKSTITIETDTISLKSLGLKGKVSSVSDFSFVAVEKNGSIIKGEEIESYPDDKKLKWNKSLYLNRNILSDYRTIKYKYYFDINGKNTRKENYMSISKLPYWIINYIYGNNHRLLEVKEKIIFTEETIPLNSKYTYENRKVKQIDKYRKNEMWERTLFEYENENLKSIKIFNNKGDLSESYVYEYNNNILSSVRIINMGYYEDEEKGYVKSEKIVKFDNNGSEIYKYSKDLDGEDDYYFIEESNCEYNSLGKKIKCISERYKYENNSKHDAFVNVYKYIYDRDKIKEIYSCKEDETPFNIEKYKYSEDTTIIEDISIEDNEVSKEIYSKGLLTKIEEINGDIFEYKYTFDNKGNWIKVVEYKNTIPIKMRVREIKYYLN